MAIGKKLYRLAEAIAATMLAAVFFTFILQILWRYVVGDPLGWTLELCLSLWIWIVFFCSSFLLRNREQVSFDVLYHVAPRNVQRVFAFLSAVLIVGAMLYAFLPTLDYVQWMSRRDSALLKIPMNWLFSIYIIFMIAVILRYTRRIYRAITNKLSNKDHNPFLEGVEEAEDAS